METAELDVALEELETRLERLRALYGTNATLEVARRPEGGTIATLRIPYRALGPEATSEGGETS